MKLGDYQIDNLKLTTLGWWSAMHGEQILRGARGLPDASVSGREKQERRGRAPRKMLGQGNEGSKSGDTIAQVNGEVLYRVSVDVDAVRCAVECDVVAHTHLHTKCRSKRM